MSESPYLFRASIAPLHEDTPTLKVKQASMLGGLRLRYQERYPGQPPEPWCSIGHSMVLVSGHLRIEFDDHAIDLLPGDMAHIPPGVEHRHRSSPVGEAPAKYYLTSFSWDDARAPKPTPEDES